MLLGGDEIGRSQNGNNNGYCQDNEISWFDWESADKDLLEFTRQLIQLRKEHPVFHRRRYFQGRPIHGAQVTGYRLVYSRWSRDDTRRLNGGFCQSARCFPQRRGHPKS